MIFVRLLVRDDRYPLLKEAVKYVDSSERNLILYILEGESEMDVQEKEGDFMPLEGIIGFEDDYLDVRRDEFVSILTNLAE